MLNLLTIYLHAKWLFEFYNYINSSDGQKITRNGWLRAGITDAIKMGGSKLPSLDPFLDICSDIDFVVNENSSQVEFTFPKLVHLLEPRHQDTDSEYDSDWEEEETHDDENAFDAFKN